MSKSPQYNQQTEPKQWKSEVEEICICQNLKSGRHSIYIRKQIVGSILERNPSNNLKVVTFSDASFSKKRIYVYDHAA